MRPQRNDARALINYRRLRSASLVAATRLFQPFGSLARQRLLPMLLRDDSRGARVRPKASSHSPSPVRSGTARVQLGGRRRRISGFGSTSPRASARTRPASNQRNIKKRKQRRAEHSRRGTRGRHRVQVSRGTGYEFLRAEHSHLHWGTVRCICLRSAPLVALAGATQRSAANSQSTLHGLVCEPTNELVLRRCSDLFIFGHTWRGVSF